MTESTIGAFAPGELGHYPEARTDDGEDHELLFTSQVQPSLGTRIGSIVEGRDVRIQHGNDIEVLEARGWEHRL